MEDAPPAKLDDETTAWCHRARRFLEHGAGEVPKWLGLVREGILLRRRWDRIDADANPRRQLLTLLAAAQDVCHRKLAEGISDSKAPEPQRVERIAGRLAEDDRYLAELLGDHTLPAESIAFAVECFRDDLHWLGTLVALLDGTRGVDFTGRILLEQESLQRSMETWENGTGAAAPQELLDSSRRLRATALARQAETLLAQPAPQDLDGWYRAWQAAGRLVIRLEKATAAELESAVQEYRRWAIAGWTGQLAQLPPERRSEALRRTADDLADLANESLTFLEDMPLGEAVQGLEVLAEDTAVCLDAVQRHGGKELGKLRRSLGRRKRMMAGEWQERVLSWRMEGLFGHRAVAALERLILMLLLAFVVMLLIETPLVRRYPHLEAAFAWADLGICMALLAEFTLKIGLAPGRWLFLRRNFITMLLPSIPFGFLVYQLLPAVEALASVEAAETIVLLRLFRLPRMIRLLRIARPVIRLGRLLAFVLQASDRLVRQVAPLLNRDLVLFERAAIKVRQPPYRTLLASLRERFRYRASEVFATLPQPARWQLAGARMEDLTAMLSAPGVGMVAPPGKAEMATVREIPLERIIARLLAATPAGISENIGRTLAQSVARWCRAFDVFAVRRLPVIRDLVAAGRRASPYGTTAQVANRLGVLLRQLLDRVYWMADLYGTVTAPQLVDSIGDWMVKGTARPARRFLIIGLAFLVVSYLAGLLPFDALRQLTRTLDSLIATPLVVLGILCLIPLLVGLWFRQIAGEATDFCTRVAEAQFITATKQLKRRFARPHHALLHRRVIAPELELAAQDSPSPGGCRQQGDRGQNDARQADRTAVERLWDDYLDAAPFHRTDTRTTTQLLGNLVLVSLCETRLHYGRKRRKHLRGLDLANARVSLRGPYLWFHFISRSLAQQTAKLVVDYNAHALPLDRAVTAGDEEIDRYLDWLSGRLEVQAEEIDLPEPFRRRCRNRPAGANRAHRRRRFHGNDFTAIHFLSADAQIEAEVARRYGPQVAELMRRDRRDNIRRVFRTYPFHHLPRQYRTFNPLTLYARHLAGGRVLLLPLKLAWASVVWAIRAARLLATFVRDVLNPTVGDLAALKRPDPYAVAVRKIHRMRMPVFLECLRMRAEFDPEYLGVQLPGCPAGARRDTVTPVEEDLARIDADPGVRQEFQRLAAQCRRQVLEFRRLLAELGCQLQPEALRAMAIAYVIDYHGARSRLEATAQLKRAFDEVVAGEGPTPAAGRGWSVRALWCRWLSAGRIRRLFRQPAFAGYDPRQQAVCRKLLCRQRGPLLAALRQLTPRGGSADPAGDARGALLAAARDPATWTRQLVVLRAVQTLSVLDLKTYCDLVAELGEYATCTPGPSDGIVPEL